MSDAPNTIEKQYAHVLAEVVRADQVSIDSDFFQELGADSMVMARFCARVRKRADLPSVSMKDVYQNPTIRRLVAAVSSTPSVPLAVPDPPQEQGTAAPASTLQYVFCGVLQFLSFLGYFYLLALTLLKVYKFGHGIGVEALIVRSLIAGGTYFIAACVLPIALKWVLIGRWQQQRIRIWSLAYVRFWFVKTVVQLNPAVLFAGTPLYVLYLRALGAKIGSNAVIFSIHVPVCTDLCTVGDGAVIRKDAFFNCYRARGGFIETGRVSIGKNAFVGEMTVLDIDTSVGDGAQIGHSSSLHTGQSVPDGEHRCGSPATHRTDVDYRAVEPAGCGILRKTVYSIAELSIAVLLSSLVVAAFVVAFNVLADRPGVVALRSGNMPHWRVAVYLLSGSFVLYVGPLLLLLGFELTFPRLLNLALKPGRVYRLYGFHYWAHRTIERTTNILYFKKLFGDSSYIVNYLSWLGYDLSPVVQTGSNFGSILKHTTPYLVKVGGGTMIADGLSIINAEYSSTSFRVSPATIGGDSFLGNYVAYPSRARTGGNCLLGTKVMVPLDGAVREGIGLLGSPAFEIPRTVLRDTRYEVTPQERSRRLASKNRHNLVTIGVFLLTQWIYNSALLFIAGLGAAFYSSLGEALALTLAFVPAVAFRIFYSVLVEHAATSFRPLQPRNCSIYDPQFWFHERYWKLTASIHDLRFINGTPLKGFIWRLLGVRMGRRLFDDGCHIVEATMITIGDDCMLNEASNIQPHSQEDGGFKSDRVRVGNDCTLGVAALVHYGASVGDGAELAADSFVMKGEEVPPHARWGENPARDLHGRPRTVRSIEATAALYPAASCGAVTVQGEQSA